MTAPPSSLDKGDHPVEESGISRRRFSLGLDGVDAFGIIFFGQYCSWFQHAIEGFFEDCGHLLREIIDEGIGFPIARFELDCRKPLRLSDKVTAETTVTEVGNRSIHLQVEFSDDDGDVVAVARSVQVTVRKDFAPAAAPEWLRRVQSGSAAR